MAKRPSDCGESSSHDNTKELPTSRRHRKSWVGVQCPICGLTLREGQVKQHYDAEVAKLGELHKKKQKKKSKTHNPLSEGDGDVVNKTALNRAKEILSDSKKHRLVWKCSNPLSQVGLGGVAAEQICPLCGDNVDGSPSDLTAHVENCLSRTTEVQSSDGSELDTYEWCGETRIRVSSMLPTAALPEHVVVASVNKDEDDMIDIEGDDELDVFGPPQYEEYDLIPCNSSEENPEVISGQGQQNCEDSSSGGKDCLGSQSSDTCGGGIGGKSSSSEKGKKRMNKQTQLKCPICMDSFITPVVSVKCWHVYCEECWLRSLGSQRLCAICKVITTPADLRRIFI